MKFRHYIEFAFVLLLRLILLLMPRRAALWLGRRIGDLAHALDARHRKLVMDNLDLAYGEELSLSEKKRITRGTYQHFASMFIDLIRPYKVSERKLAKLAEYQGMENLQAAYDLGKGVLVLTAHYGYWELMGVAQGYTGNTLDVLARQLDNPLLDNILRNYRSQSGNNVVYKKNAIKAIMETLKAKRGAAVLIDQNVNPNRGIFVNFFGVPACTTTVVSSLAVKTGAPIVPAFSMPLPGGRWKFIYEKPVEYELLENRKETIDNLTQECTNIIESYIRKQPEIWLWLHRRWKTRPPEENLD